MGELGIQSKYTNPSYKPIATRPNNDASVQNVLNLEFEVVKKMSSLVSDLTYVKVGYPWNYVCFFKLVPVYQNEMNSSDN